MAVDDDHPAASDLESREPSLDDLVELCRHLNAEKARYVIVGGFAIRAAGYDRRTLRRRAKSRSTKSTVFPFRLPLHACCGE